MHITTDKRLFKAWLSNLAGAVIENYLQQHQETPEAQHASYRVSLHPGVSNVKAPEEPESPLSDSPAHTIQALRDRGLTYKEVATYLDIPVGTVRSRLFRARRGRVRRQDAGTPVDLAARFSEDVRQDAPGTTDPT